MQDSVAPHDLSRAFACATAISQRCVTAGRIDSFMSAGDFGKYVNRFMIKVEPQYRIQKVHLSSESEKQQFVMAIAEDAIFIGFRGTKDFADIACDLQVCKTTDWQEGGASYHRGIHGRSKAFLGLLGSNLLNSLLRTVLGTTGNSDKRIVFCGHSLGGAVAHLVLMRLLLENLSLRNDIKDPHKFSPENMISIAFGAPHFCDEIAAALINDVPSFKCRFTTFVNRRDPVPRLLHHLPSSVAKAIDATIELIGTRIGALGWFAGDGPRGENLAGEAAPDSDAAGSSNVPDRYKCDLYQNEVTDLKKYAARSQGAYHPIGFYIFLCQGSPRLLRVASATEELSRRLSDVQLGEECVGEHRGTSYGSALLEAELIHVEDLGKEPPPRSFLDTALEPVVHSATGKQSDSAKAFTVTVTGKNLLFLREVQWRRLGTPHQIEAGDFGIAKDDELMFWCRCTSRDMEELTKRARQKELKNKELRIGKLVVRTAFGRIESHIIAEFCSGVDVDNATPRLLPRLSQAVMVARSLQAENFSNDNVRNRLNGILKCAPLNNDLPTFQHLFEQPTTNLEASMQLTEMESNLINFLHEGFNVRYKSKKLPKDAMRAFVGAAAIAAAFATLSIATPCMILLTYKAGVTGFKILDQMYVDNWQYYFDSYESFVKFAVDEVGTWPSNVPVKASKDRQSIATLENDLVKRVNAVSGNFFKDMVDEACGASTDSGNGAVTYAWPHHFPRVASILKGAEDETKRNVFRKTKVIVETKKLYKEVVAGTCFVALMGEEDAGKTTFIKKAILAENDENPSWLETPEPSASEHTKQPRPYKGKDELWLVDFPGTNGTEDYAVYWNQYTALPSFIVFLFDYNGDVKSNQVEIYKNLKQKTSTPIMVAFNRVDQRFDRNSRPELLQQGFFSRLQANAAKKLGCDEKDVFYVALEPGHPDEFPELQGAGVLGFDDFMNEVRCRVKDSK